MKRLMFAVTVVAAFAISSPGLVAAGSDQHTDPGTPGEPNCYGQMAAWFVQGNQVIQYPAGTYHEIPGPGGGNAVRQLDEILPIEVTQQTAKAWTDAFCAAS